MNILALSQRGRSALPKVRPMAVVLVVGAAAAMLPGCRDDLSLSDHMAAMLNDPERRHAITFEQQAESLIIEAPGGAGLLGHEQLALIHRFIRHYKDESTGRLKVSSPRAVGGHHATRRALRQVRDIMMDHGIDPATVKIRRYRGARKSWPTIRLSYQRPVAVSPVCGDWSENVGVNRERIHYRDYGCAAQRNLAASVDNARDLIEPREITPRSSERRSVTWTDYVDAKGGANRGNKATVSPKTTRGP